ncbi:MAG: NAD(P)/FAD-dependent oxidoreductase [Lachnospiraceae bacterium]|nr:NAD(P)/FAD-dependent oxidoreductase [Lachnospiraceae bacterium]
MKIIVVGGGAAGMMAAIGAAESGCAVTLIERNEKLGKKIYITGKGRCNLTNDCPADDLMKNVVRNPKFLYSSFGAWDNSDTIRLMNEEGCETKTERGGRVFPVSDHASDVIRALKRRMDRLGVNVRLDCEMTALDISGGLVQGVVVKGGEIIKADHVIIACGGASYPTTGSDGRAYEILKKIGIKINVPRPALVPIICSDDWIPSVQGLSLKNVKLTLLDGKRKLYDELGEMLFTDKGISGPLALSAGSYYEPACRIVIDCKPGLSAEKLDERILRDFKEYSNRDFSNSLSDLLPKSLIPVVIGLSGIAPDKKVHQITGEERGRLGSLIKGLEVHPSGTAGFGEAIITRGGVDVKEIDPSTMCARSVRGLSFAGEIIDVDALTGGFNLQIAWSTGYLAGTRAAWT